MINNKHLLFKPIKQALSLLKEQDAINILLEVIRDYPSVVSVDLIYTKDLHKMAGESWVERDDTPHSD